MLILDKITTEYLEEEDRLRLSGAAPTGESCVFWLTQRLASRLIAPLTRWLGEETTQHPAGDLLQNWAQMAALTGQEPLPPVQADIKTSAWLVLAVDITRQADGFFLTFRGHGGQSARLYLNVVAMRQWLAILHQHYLAADWRIDAWPTWMEQPATSAPAAYRLH